VGSAAKIRPCWFYFGTTEVVAEKLDFRAKNIRLEKTSMLCMLP
jgi:hypothetical protein